MNIKSFACNILATFLLFSITAKAKIITKEDRISYMNPSDRWLEEKHEKFESLKNDLKSIGVNVSENILEYLALEIFYNVDRRAAQYRSTCLNCLSI